MRSGRDARARGPMGRMAGIPPRPSHGKGAAVPERRRQQAKKRFLLRLDPAIYEALRRWADDEWRSVNAQIEYVLRDALRRAGRLPGTRSRPRAAGEERPEPPAGHADDGPRSGAPPGPRSEPLDGRSAED